MKRVIITGATSMIGLALIDECIQNNVPVIAVVRPNSDNLEKIPITKLVQIVECNISSYNSLSDHVSFGPGVFYHFAWIRSGKNRDDDIIMQSNNIGYTLDALNCAKSIGCDLFIGAGSQAEYGQAEGSVYGPETVERPDSPYGICKYTAGKLAMLHSRKIGIDCIWTRVFSVYGLNDHRDTMISYSLERIKNSLPTFFSEGTQMWDYLYARDAGRAFFMIGINGKSDTVYCIASGKSAPLKDFIEIIRDVTNPTNEMKFIREEGKKTRWLCADINNLSADTGFNAIYTFRYGIEEIWRQINPRCDCIPN